MRTSTVGLLILVHAATAAENWPGWRGPRGDGSSTDTNVAREWDGPTGKNVKWKVPIPGKSHSSPVIWEDRIFLVSADEKSQERSLMCLDRTSGKTRWFKRVLGAPFEKIHRLNTRSSSTPATDGQRVYVSFLDKKRMYVAAYDFSGNKQWEARPGAFSSRHGYCSSPVLYRDKVIVNGDHDGPAYIVALNRDTGETIWKTKRPNGVRSYCAPILRRIDGRNQLILSGSRSVASFDPDTGRQHWIIDGPTDQFVASLVYNRGLLFMTAGFPDHHILAIDPTGKGNVTKTHVKWRTIKGCSYVPSPAAVDNYFLVVADNGIASCFDAVSGERHWMARLESHYSASTINANGLCYFNADNGVTTIVKPGQALEVEVRNDLGEEMYASPAVYDGELYLRGVRHLFCIHSTR
ncbi:MAG: PQQ-binding-like beta-propeller repeat protein [Verrucomicrobiota bacterium]